MSHTYPVADFLTRIRNAQKAKHRWVDIPASKTKKQMSVILKREGFIKDIVLIDDGLQGRLRVYLKYSSDGEGTIEGIKCISKPGRRVYCRADTIPRVLNGLGLAIISTSSGVMSGNQAKSAGVGGEVLCHVW